MSSQINPNTFRLNINKSWSINSSPYLSQKKIGTHLFYHNWIKSVFDTKPYSLIRFNVIENGLVTFINVYGFRSSKVFKFKIPKKLLKKKIFNSKKISSLKFLFRKRKVPVRSAKYKKYVNKLQHWSVPLARKVAMPKKVKLKSVKFMKNSFKLKKKRFSYLKSKSTSKYTKSSNIKHKNYPFGMAKRYHAKLITRRLAKFSYLNTTKRLLKKKHSYTYFTKWFLRTNSKLRYYKLKNLLYFIPKYLYTDKSVNTPNYNLNFFSKLKSKKRRPKAKKFDNKKYVRVKKKGYSSVRNYLKFKMLEYRLSQYTNQPVKVNFFNYTKAILMKKSYKDLLKIDIFLIKKKLKYISRYKKVTEIVSALRLSAILNSSLPIAQFIVNTISTVRRHKKDLQTFSNIIDTFIGVEKINKSFSNIYAVKYQIAGKYENSKKAAKFQQIHTFDVPRTSFNKNLNYTFLEAFTPKGVLGIKVFIYLVKKPRPLKIKGTLPIYKQIQFNSLYSLYTQQFNFLKYKNITFDKTFRYEFYKNLQLYASKICK